MPTLQTSEEAFDFEKLANRHYHDYINTWVMTEGSVSTDSNMLKLINMLKKHPEIKGLDLSRNAISKDAVNMLVACLKTDCPQITSLFLSETNLDDEGIKAIASIPSITKLGVSMNKFTGEGARELAQHTNFTYLDTSYNPSIGSAVVAEIVANNPALIELKISGNFYAKQNEDGNYIGNETAKSMTELGKALKTATNISLLEINNLAMAGYAQFLSHLKLKRLSIRNSNLNNQDMKSLTTIGTLKYLDISGNRIGDEGLSNIGSLTSLTSLNAMSNSIHGKGTQLIANLKGLKKLVLDYNEIGDEGAIALIQNTTITELGAEYCNVSNKNSLKALLDRRMYRNESKDLGIRYSGIANQNIFAKAQIPAVTDGVIQSETRNLEGSQEQSRDPSVSLR